MTFAKLFYHIVWATNNREPFITSEIEPRIFRHLVENSYSLGCNIIAINGSEDHVHLLIQIPPKYAVADIVKKLKGSSSFDFQDLFWQRGYGALTVSERNLNAAIDYIKRQKEHHFQNTIINKYEKCDDDKERTEKLIRENQDSYEIGETTSDFEF
ncbi:MAG TPA: IS200/IS605 family transposase [Anaerolineaceae bacterium]|nr:IS200/IS605 family transposase [Anaerolineaceae bacterium]